MSRVMVVDNSTKHAQRQASSPEQSAWVSANAGSGKTYVLAQRVVRLLLSGVEPSTILCLTYTKAAAGEMSIRVFDILGRWVSLSEEDLIKELTTIEGRQPSAVLRKRARILFARALETPGGLNIQTIHAFCESLLHRFPMEANVPGQFSVADDLLQAQLIADARRDVVLAADSFPQSEIGQSFLHMLGVASDQQIEKVFEAIVNHRAQITDWLQNYAGPDDALQEARSRFGLTATDTVEKLTQKALDGCAFTRWDCAAIADFCDTTTEKSSHTLALKLRNFTNSQSPDTKLAAAVSLVLVANASEARKFTSYPTKKVAEAFPGLRESMAGEAQRLLDALDQINSLRQIENTRALLTVAKVMMDHYRRSKLERGLLDFDDLIERTSDLLSGQARSWVLYRLDQGIDHVLLDEAQDTSPKQWRIISALTEEFFVGDFARPAKRTIFAVGDEKQSIYSFRGAEPRNFALQRRNYMHLSKGSKSGFSHVGLELSFRSTADVLGAVDAVFSIPENAEGVTFEGPAPGHTPARRHDPGAVEVWDLIGPEKGDEPPNWHTPADFAGQHQALILAEKIARQIKSWIGREPIAATGELMKPGDILVLVRSRDRFVGALSRALKSLGVAVAGADRLTITDHIAVQDLMAVARFVLLPQDDLSLAVILKCPLLGLSEEDLYELSRRRFSGQWQLSLFEALCDAPEPKFHRVRDLINGWRALADQLPVYEFFSHILDTQGGRRKFRSRLGGEVVDVLDAFLDSALSREEASIPGLQAFLTALDEERPEIKREMNQAAGEVRIMTVHSAKGLEAPVVFLVDKCSEVFQPQHAPVLYEWKENGRIEGYSWIPSAADHTRHSRTLWLEQKTMAEAEYKRLLYVGMTRAEDRLIICGYHGERIPSLNWHGMVSKALEPDWEEIVDPGGALLWYRWRSGQSPTVPHLADEQSRSPIETPKAPLPGWINGKLRPEAALPRPLNPSGTQAVIDEALVRDTKVMSPFDDHHLGRDPSLQRKRGTVLHRLLQMLPDVEVSSRRQAAQTYIDRQLPQLPVPERKALCDSIEAVLNHPDLQQCFDPQTSRSEVPIMGLLDSVNSQRTGRKRPVSGTIDRLAILNEYAVILDYKTSTNVPHDVATISADIVLQMALYQRLVAQLYPNKPIRCLVVWTHAAGGPSIMELSSGALNEAILKLSKL